MIGPVLEFASGAGRILRGAMNSITSRRNAKIVGAALAASVVLAACGGSSGGGAQAPSALDPANMVPAGSVAYAELAIRPQGGLARDLVQAINSIAGPGAAQKLSRSLAKSLGKQWKQIKPWAGEYAGVALTGIPTDLSSGSKAFESNVLVVLPTADPAAARHFLAKNPPGPGYTQKVVGSYVIVGGANAVGQAEATTAKASLAADSGFKADMTQLGGDQLFTLYAPLHQLLSAIVPLMKSNPAFNAAALAKAESQAPPGSSVALGAAALHDQFRLDLISHGTHSTASSAQGADVGALPAGSWLALSLGGSLTQSSAVSALAKALPRELARIQALTGKTNAIPSGPLEFVEKDLLPALGPMSLSVAGTSESTLQAGLVISPLNHSAGARLATGIKQLVKGLPISASTAAGKVAVTFGYRNLQQLLEPSSKLSGNPTFQHALAQLPAGSKAAIYLNFAPITMLASLDHGSVSPSAMKALHRLDYLIAGGTHGHFRLVLTTH
jgi:hypothetical protein